MTLAVAEALNPNKPNQSNPVNLKGGPRRWQEYQGILSMA